METFPIVMDDFHAPQSTKGSSTRQKDICLNIFIFLLSHHSKLRWIFTQSVEHI